MANIKSAKKRAKQAEINRRHNQSIKSEMRTYIKNVIKAVEDNNLEAARAAFKLAESKLDSVAEKGIIHKNKAARHKSRLSIKVNALAAA